MLPAEESAVINLYYLEDLPVKEISIIMDLSVSNVKIKLFRARNTLREVFGKYVKNELKDLK
jgi:RNA polymerase sigma-70 factor (ECF subfamily)